MWTDRADFYTVVVPPPESQPSGRTRRYPNLRDGILIWSNLLTASPVFQELAWVFQIMPLFFFAGVAASTEPETPGTSWGNWFMRRCTRFYRPVFYYLAFWWVSLAVLSAVLPEHVYELWPGSQSNCCGFSAPTFWSSRACHCWPASRTPADWSPRWLAPTRSSLVSTRSGSTSRAAPHLAN